MYNIMTKENNNQILFLITDDALDYKVAENIKSIDKFTGLINEKRFKVSDTGLTYRQASHINKGVLEDDRENHQH